MAISGTDKAITPAVAGLARSGATRSGWPIAVGRLAWTYALSNIARSGATRSNYTSSHGFVAIGGVQLATGAAGPGTIVGNVTITDALNEEANRASFRVRGTVPVVGQDVRITLGSINTGAPLFAGQILQVTAGYLARPVNDVCDVAAIDWTWGLTQRSIARRWRSISATTIAQDVIAEAAPGYSNRYVQAGLAALDEFTVTNVTAVAALNQLADRIGGYWYVDYQKRIHLFTDEDPEPLTPPTDLTMVHASLTALTVERDGGQLVTRVFVEGGGSVTLTAVAPGETRIPVVNAVWYETAGGQVVSGPQRIRYTGVVAGGGGSLVGPGAAPSVAPVATVTAGAGIESGAHDYAVSFVTAAGESLPGPRITATVGTTTPPPSAPIASLDAGAGVTPGWHQWAVSFVTASGETTIGPFVTATIDPSPDPVAAPVPGTPIYGGAIEPDTYYYAVSYVTAAGETAAGPLSPSITMFQPPLQPPTEAPTPGASIPGGNVPVGEYQYMCSFVDTHGNETGYREGDPLSWVVSIPVASQIPLTAIPVSPSVTVVGRRIYRQKNPKDQPSGHPLKYVGFINNNTATTYTDNVAFASLGGSPPNTNLALGPFTNAVPLSSIPIGPTGTTKRHLYRRTNAVGLQRAAILNNNTATTHTDTVASGSLGPAPPATGGATKAKVNLTNIPIGGADVTARRIYRTPANSGTGYGRVLELSNNTATTAQDAIPDGSLGVAPPATSTATANRVQLSGLAVGAAAVTARKVYRTRAGQASLLLLTTVNDNTTTTYLDVSADALLTTAPPGSDTSGLQQPAGTINPGSTTIPVAGAAVFGASGGWAVIGNGQQVIRYTAKTTNTLTGIPASGPGAIVAAIAYNSTITAAAELIGVPASGPGAILYELPKGDDVNLWIQVDDPAAQAAVAALLSSVQGGAHSGIIEATIQDRRLSAVECRNRGRAHLEARTDVQIRIRYQSRDLNTRAGRPITVNLPAPPFGVTATFVIQTATIRAFRPNLMPTVEVEASSMRFSFEDLLRRVRERGELGS